MTFFFTESIKGMMNERVTDHDNRSRNEQPQEEYAVTIFLKKIGSKKQYGYNKPKFGQNKFKRHQRMATRYSSNQKPKQIDHY